MRTPMLTVLTLGLLLTQVPGKAQVAIPNGQGFFRATPLGCRVTLSRNGVMTGSFVFPPGTLISVIGDHQDDEPLGPFQFRYAGAFELRVIPAGDALNQDTNGSAAVWSRDPIVMTGGPGVDLLIENVP